MTVVLVSQLSRREAQGYDSFALAKNASKPAALAPFHVAATDELVVTPHAT